MIAAEISNALVSASELPQENDKFINEVEIELRQSGLNSIATYYNDVLIVAQQCPFSGGQAVYRARTFIGLLSDTITYDDQSVCLQNGIYKNLSQTPTSQQSEILIVPNPANEKVEVIFKKTFKGTCLVEILNAHGKVVAFKEVNCEEKVHSLITSSLAAGVYMVKMCQNNALSRIAKLIIQK